MEDGREGIAEEMNQILELSEYVSLHGVRIRNVPTYKAAVKKIETELIRQAEKLKASLLSAQNVFS